MLAFGLLAILAAEVIGLGMLAWHLTSGHPGEVVPLLLGFLLALWVGYGFVSTVVTYAIARYSVPRARATAIPSVGAILRETAAMVVLFTILQPFARWFGANGSPQEHGSRRPRVLLVHGYFCNSGLWWFHRREFERAGFNCVAVDLEPPWGCIEAFARQVQERLAGMHAETPAAPIVIIAHSMGGLVARAALARHGMEPVAKLVTLGTPHRGTRLGHWGVGQCAREMQPGSPFLACLAATKANAASVVSVWSPHDNYMAPVDTPLLPGSRTIAQPGLGHLSFALSPTVRRLLVAEVQAVDRHPV